MSRLIQRLRNKLRRERAAREFNKLVEAYDYAIERARAKHHPTSSLIAAKRDFVHAMLRAEMAR